MTNEMKAAFRLGLLVLALILTGFSVAYIHSTEGDTAFIGSVEHWQYVNWTPTIVEVIVIWALYAVFYFVILRPGTTRAPGGAADPKA
jgi:hypothetical protein